MSAIQTNSSLWLNGFMIVNETLPMNIELVVALSRCNLDRTGCRHFEDFIYSRLCERLAVRTSVPYIIASSIYPRPQCPVKNDTYLIKNNMKTMIDKILALPVPLAGYLWKAKCIFHEKVHLKRIRPLACVEIAVSINKGSKKSLTLHNQSSQRRSLA
jgi:hypothetical protein